jgi:hypothetical protein
MIQRLLQGAIDSVRAEFTLQQRFQLKMGRNYCAPFSNIGNLMEVDHYRYQRMMRYD